jgi:hypothetical protein
MNYRIITWRTHKPEGGLLGAAAVPECPSILLSQVAATCTIPHQCRARCQALVCAEWAVQYSWMWERWSMLYMEVAALGSMHNTPTILTSTEEKNYWHSLFYHNSGFQFYLKQHCRRQMWFLWLSYQHPHLSCMCFHVRERTRNTLLWKMGWSKSTWMIASGLAWMVWNVSLWVCPLCTMSVMPVVCQHCSSWLRSGCAIVSQTHIPSLVCSDSYPSMASFLWTKIISLFFPVLPPCHSGHQHSLGRSGALRPHAW